MTHGKSMRLAFEVWMPIVNDFKQFLFAVPIIVNGETEICCHECAIAGIRAIIKKKVNPSNVEKTAFDNTMFTIIVRDL